MLDNRYLTFLELAKHLNYTHTAKKLALTQPTVTKHIQAIEDELKIKLFSYQNKTLALTNDGEYLARELSFITDKINDIKQNFCQLSNPKILKIGASHAIGEYFIPKYTKVLNQDTQLFPYNLVIENHSILLNKLANNDIDCALLSGPTIANDTYSSFEFYSDDIVLICNTQHRFANQTVSINEINNEAFILRETDSGIYQSLFHQLENYHFPLDLFNNVSHVGNISLISHIIQQQNKMSFFYRSTIENELKAARVAQIHLSDIDLSQKFVLLYHSKLIENSRIQPLIHLLTQLQEDINLMIQ